MDKIKIIWVINNDKIGEVEKEITEDNDVVLVKRNSTEARRIEGWNGKVKANIVIKIVIRSVVRVEGKRNIEVLIETIRIGVIWSLWADKKKVSGIVGLTIVKDYRVGIVVTEIKNEDKISVVIGPEDKTEVISNFYTKNETD